MRYQLRLWIIRLRRRFGWYDKEHATRVQRTVRESKDLDDMVERLKGKL